MAAFRAERGGNRRMRPPCARNTARLSLPFESGGRGAQKRATGDGRERRSGRNDVKIFICRKSLSDLKNPIVKEEYTTVAATVEELIREMVAKNYEKRPVKESLAACQALAEEQFEDGGYYIVNATLNMRYGDLRQALQLTEGDELVLIRLKYIRGCIW